jgi:aminoglycoside phosphotransferase (APT) family kinase protein
MSTDIGGVEPSLAAISLSLTELGLELRRSWPRSAEQLLLDLQDESGGRVAGQWFRDPDRARATAAATPGARCTGRIVLQPGGADRRLAALRDLLAEPGTELVSHRPERRAVLRHTSERAVPQHGGDRADRYTKVVPVKKHQALEAASRAAAALPLRTPRVHSTDARRGTVTTEALPGRTLHDLLSGSRAEAACASAGGALAALHRIPPPQDLPVHGWAEEQAVTGKWQQHAASYAAPLAFGGSPSPGDVIDVDSSEAPGVLIHRDFHDLQVLVDSDGSVGVLDFDLMAVGDPALDLANLLAHLELRRRQGLVADAEPLRRAVLSGYAPSEETVQRIPGYEVLAGQRLAAVYAFRDSRRIT